MTALTSFLLEYWLNFLLGAIAGAITILAKKQYTKFKKMEELYREEEKKNFLEEVNRKINDVEKLSDEKDKEINEKLDKMNILIAKIIDGVIATQHDRLYSACIKCLKKECITETELINIQQLYASYEDLGGNHGMKEIYNKTMKLPMSDCADFDEE